jgi:hypothetical protein
MAMELILSNAWLWRRGGGAKKEVAWVGTLVATEANLPAAAKTLVAAKLMVAAKLALLGAWRLGSPLTEARIASIEPKAGPKAGPKEAESKFSGLRTASTGRLRPSPSLGRSPDLRVRASALAFLGPGRPRGRKNSSTFAGRGLGYRLGRVRGKPRTFQPTAQPLRRGLLQTELRAQLHRANQPLGAQQLPLHPFDVPC